MTSGRSVGAPTPVAAPGHDTIRDRPFSRSIAGITSMALCRRVRQQPFGAQESAMEGDRQGAVLQQRVVEPAQREGIAQAALLVASELEQQDLAQQVAQLI